MKNDDKEDDKLNEPDFDAPISNVVSDYDKEEEIEILPEMARQVNQEEKIIQPHKEITEIINLGVEDQVKVVRIGATLEGNDRERLICLLHEYQDIFARSYQDMPGLDTNIVVHKLLVGPNSLPVKQKLRRLKPDMLLKIKEEVKK